MVKDWTHIEYKMKSDSPRLPSSFPDVCVNYDFFFLKCSLLMWQEYYTEYGSDERWVFQSLCGFIRNWGYIQIPKVEIKNFPEIQHTS